MNVSDSLTNKNNLNTDEIDLADLFPAIWKKKWSIAIIATPFFFASCLYALSLPNFYRADAIYAPAIEKTGGLSGLAAQYGGLAAMAGVNLDSGESSQIDQAIALVTSWPFLDMFINKYNLEPMIIAVKGWDSTSGEIVFDSDIYDIEKKDWVNADDAPKSYKVYRKLLRMVSITKDSKSGLITISVEHEVPVISRDWVVLLAIELNKYFQKRDMVESQKNIEYLREKINETGIAEMQSVFYGMIESQMKTLMLTEVSDEYLIKTVVEPKTPEIKSGPKRSLICLGGLLIGTFIGMVFTLVSGRYLPSKM